MIGVSKEECKVEVSGKATPTATHHMRSNYTPPFYVEHFGSVTGKSSFEPPVVKDTVGARVSTRDICVILNLLAEGKV